MPEGIPAKEAKTEMETHHVTVEAKIKSYKHSCALHWSIHFALFLQ